MNKSVLIATCDFLVLAVLSLNPSDKGSYSEAEKKSPANLDIAKPIASNVGLKPSEDFKVEPLKPEIVDNFDSQLLILAADDEKSAISKKLEEAQKNAEKVKELLAKEQEDRQKLKDELTQTAKNSETLKQNIEAERQRVAAEKKKQQELNSELSKLRESFVGVTDANQQNQKLLTELQKQKQTIADSRAYMKAKLLESLHEKRKLKEELEQAKKIREEIAKAKAEAESKLVQVSSENQKLQTDLKVTQYKHEVVQKERQKVEEKLAVVADERNKLQSNLAVTKKESEVLNTEVSKLQKQIFGPSPEINKTLFKTTFKIKENDYMASVYKHSSYSPVVKINGGHYTITNYENMWLNKAIVPSRALMEFSISQKSEITGKSYRVSKSFKYFASSPQTLLIPCAPDPNALKISASVNAITDVLPTLFIMKQDSGKVLKLDNMFYDRETKTLVMEQGLAEDVSANQPSLGDLIVDPQGDLIGVFAKSKSSFSFSKSTRLEAYIFKENSIINTVQIGDLSKIPSQLKNLRSTIR